MNHSLALFSVAAFLLYSPVTWAQLRDNDILNVNEAFEFPPGRTHLCFTNRTGESKRVDCSGDGVVTTPFCSIDRPAEQSKTKLTIAAGFPVYVASFQENKSVLNKNLDFVLKATVRTNQGQIQNIELKASCKNNTIYRLDESTVFKILKVKRIGNNSPTHVAHSNSNTKRAPLTPQQEREEETKAILRTGLLGL